MNRSRILGSVLLHVGLLLGPTAGLVRAGTLQSWGSDSYGQVSGTPSGSDFTAISASAFTDLALR